MVGIKLEAMLIGLFVVYVVILLVRAGDEKKRLKAANREMGYIISGVRTLFPRFAMADFTENTYQYLAGTRPEDSSLAVKGDYEYLRRYMSSIQHGESERKESAKKMHRDAIIEALSEYSDLRFECYVIRNGQLEWEHMNIICLERTVKRARC